jgi:hypothetical protein
LGRLDAHATTVSLLRVVDARNLSDRNVSFMHDPRGTMAMSLDLFGDVFIVARWIDAVDSVRRRVGRALDEPIGAATVESDETERHKQEGTHDNLLWLDLRRASKESPHERAGSVLVIARSETLFALK